jgi:hypothetical protein
MSIGWLFIKLAVFFIGLEFAFWTLILIFYGIPKAIYDKIFEDPTIWHPDDEPKY